MNLLVLLLIVIALTSLAMILIELFDASGDLTQVEQSYNRYYNSSKLQKIEVQSPAFTAARIGIPSSYEKGYKETP